MEKEDRGERIEAVRLHLGGVADEQWRQSPESGGEERRPRLEEAPGQTLERDEPSEAGREWNQAEPQLARAGQARCHPLPKEKTERSHLLVGERMEEPGEGAGEDVEGDERLVEPERAAGEEFCEADRHANDDDDEARSTFSEMAPQ
jgi:hypothetical protein